MSSGRIEGILLVTALLLLPHSLTASANEMAPPVAATGLGCDASCLARVPIGTAAPIVWQHGAVAYAVADAPLIGDYRGHGTPLTIVEPTNDTVPLYALFGVRPDQDTLIGTYGAIVDRAADVRLLAVSHLPLRITELVAVGMHVEKVMPSCRPFAPTALPPLSLPDTLTAIAALGTSDATPLGDREYDGPGAVLTAADLTCRFETLGFAVSTNTFTDWQGHLQANIVALPPGKTLGADMTLITAHDDSISPAGQSAPGADDNASGVTAMLALADREARMGFPHRVGFVAFAAEEPGLVGSAVFAGRLASAGIPLGSVINLDAIGVPNGGRIYVNGSGAMYGLYTDLAQIGADGYTLQWMYSPGPISDDQSLRAYGFPAIMLTTHPFGTSPLHHTQDDRIEHVDFDQLAVIIDLVWRWLLQAGE